MPLNVDANLQKGMFLLASPKIIDGIFFRSVILLCDHSSSGSFGVIVNKLAETSIPDELINLKEMSSANVSFRIGGPVDPNQIVVLHSSHQGEAKGDLSVCDGVYLGSHFDSFQERSFVEKPDLLFCLGYSIWSAGLLEQEYFNGMWFLHRASKRHLFETPFSRLWQTLLREMGGKYKTLSMIPENLDLN